MSYDIHSNCIIIYIAWYLGYIRPVYTPVQYMPLILFIPSPYTGPMYALCPSRRAWARKSCKPWRRSLTIYKWKVISPWPFSWIASGIGRNRMWEWPVVQQCNSSRDAERQGVSFEACHRRLEFLGCLGSLGLQDTWDTMRLEFEWYTPWELGCNTYSARPIGIIEHIFAWYIVCLLGKTSFSAFQEDSPTNSLRQVA